MKDLKYLLAFIIISVLTIGYGAYATPNTVNRTGELSPIRPEFYGVGTSTAPYKQSHVLYASSTALSAYDGLQVGNTSTTTIVGDGGLSYFNGDVEISGGLTVPVIIAPLTEGDHSVTGDLFIYGGDINLGTGSATSTLTSNGRLGLGSTTPWALHSIEYTSAVDQDNPVFAIGDQGSSTPQFVVDYAGNVGIGTENPGTPLDVTTGLDGGFITTIYNTDADAGFGLNVRAGDATEDILRLQNVGGTQVFNVKGSGNVGIGTTSPSATLAIESSTSNEPRVMIKNTAGDTGMARLEFMKAGGGSPADDDSLGQITFAGDNSASENIEDFSYAFIRGVAEDVTDGTEDGQLLFSTTANGSAATRLAIANGGNVGIGTTSPRAIFAIEGNSSSTPALLLRTNTTNPAIHITQNGSGRGLDITREGTSGYIRAQVPSGGDGLLDIGNGIASGAIRLNSGNGQISWTGTANDFIDLDSGIWSTQSADMRIDPDEGSAGTLQIGDVGDNDILYVTGNVGIGTTSPAFKLSVNGTALIGSTLTVEGKLDAQGGVDPPYVSYTGETHESIREYAKELKGNQVVMRFWNIDTDRWETYKVAEDKFYPDGGGVPVQERGFSWELLGLLGLLGLIPRRR